MAQKLLGMSDAGANVFVAAMLHLGSLGAIVVYYARDILKLFTERRFEMGLIAIGSVPAAVVGLSLKDSIEQLFGSPLIVCGSLVVTGAWLFAAERWGRPRDPLAPRHWKAALAIGIAQAAALVPGLSRSGLTIGAGYLLGVDRKDAVRFAFLLGIPAIGGAGLLKLREGLAGEVAVAWGPTAAAVALCFVVSLGALKLLELLALRGKLVIFAVYCVVVGSSGALAILL